MSILVCLAICVLLANVVQGLASSSTLSRLSNLDTDATSRRSLFRTLWNGAVLTTIATSTGSSGVQTASAADSGEDSVYFGVGCFWHIQNSFVEAERKFLNRSAKELTSLAGYAGGKSADKEGRVCYHNFQSVADYGKLGHGEVVGMRLPTDRIPDFAAYYFALFDPRTKDRVDPMDRGGEYRSLIGLPGGTTHSTYAQIEQAATNAGFNLETGKGNDPDTLGKKLVYVYDSNVFPFYQAEVYHQFHNDFQSPPYGKAYNQLADVALEDGRIRTTGCPDRV